MGLAEGFVGHLTETQPAVDRSPPVGRSVRRTPGFAAAAGRGAGPEAAAVCRTDRRRALHQTLRRTLFVRDRA